MGDSTLKYLLTYKLSQDHLELFFAAVRSSCGSKNNPTDRQYSAAYKRLLTWHDVQAVTGNCKALDNTHILFVTSNTVTHKNEPDLDTYDMSLVCQFSPENNWQLITIMPTSATGTCCRYSKNLLLLTLLAM